MENFQERAEKMEMFRRKSDNSSSMMFHTVGSSGNNPLRLAQILSVFDFVIHTLGWSEKPIAKFTTFLTQYQASLDAKYHNDYKDVLIAEEIERRRAERKGISILQGGS